MIYVGEFIGFYINFGGICVIVRIFLIFVIDFYCIFIGVCM